MCENCFEVARFYIKVMGNRYFKGLKR